MALTNTHKEKVDASGTDANVTKYMLNVSGEKVRVKTLYLNPYVSVSTHASNYMTFNVKKGSTTIATATTNSSGGAALTAGTPVAMTITGTGKDLEIDSAGVLTVECAKSGTGPAYGLEVVGTFEGIRQ